MFAFLSLLRQTSKVTTATAVNRTRSAWRFETRWAAATATAMDCQNPAQRLRDSSGCGWVATTFHSLHSEAEAKKNQFIHKTQCLIRNLILRSSFSKTTIETLFSTQEKLQILVWTCRAGLGPLMCYPWIWLLHITLIFLLAACASSRAETTRLTAGCLQPAPHHASAVHVMLFIDHYLQIITSLFQSW